MKKPSTTSKINRLKSYLRELEGFLKKGISKTDQRIHILIFKIKMLVQDLRRVYSVRQLKRIVGSLTLVFGAALFNHSEAQSFLPPVENPFGITSPGVISFHEFVDLDSDGDQDIIVSSGYGNITYYENTGSADNPDFSSAPVNNPFGLSASSELRFPTMVDFDNDGDFDLLQGGYYGMFYYTENVGTPTTPNFIPNSEVQNPFGLEPTYYYAFVDAADMDNDGDIDLLSGEYYGNFKYYENVGTPSSPAFSAPILNAFGLNIVNQLAFPEMADLDNDGDFDVLVGEYYGNFKYFQNTGSASSPVFSAAIQNPFGLGQQTYLAYPASVDMDDDGDMDLVITGYYGEFFYYENLLISNNIQELSQEITVYPNPVNDYVHIRSENNIEAIRVLDLSGKEVLSEIQLSSEIDVRHLESGSYIIEFTLESEQVLKKPFVKQ